jgi:hypothetical protein
VGGNYRQNLEISQEEYQVGEGNGGVHYESGLSRQPERRAVFGKDWGLLSCRNRGRELLLVWKLHATAETIDMERIDSLHQKFAPGQHSQQQKYFIFHILRGNIQNI